MALKYSLSFRVKLPARHHLNPARTIGRKHLFASNSIINGAVTSNLQNLLVPTSNKLSQFIFVGGKGGVGKTSSSSAIAIACSDAGLKTLIVSTDPAHSLGDALAVDLSSGDIQSIATEDNLFALEIDVDKAMDQFQELARGLDTDNLANSLGVPKEIIDTLGLNDLTSIFKNPPPGIDEIVALTNIFKYSKEKLPNGSPRFDRIIIDTAPTGHTLRLLQLPLILTSITSKLIKFRSKLASAVDSFKSLFGGGSSNAAPSKFMDTLSKLEVLQDNLASLKEALSDPYQTTFTVVTIPTSLAIAESERLVSSLKKQNIKVSSIICNQVITPEFGAKYIETRRAAQRKCADIITKEAQLANIEVCEVPYVDTEVTGLFGLRYFASVAHPMLAKSTSNPINSKKLNIFGGKGGVGKTSSAASWGVRLSDSGFRTLVVSTDPAHSLGDVIGEKLDGQPRKLDDSAEGGELWAMEIDPDAALAQFQDTVKKTVDTSSTSGGGGGGFMSGFGLGQLKDDLMDMLSGVDEPPPGTDEVVALTKVVSYLEDGYDAGDGKLIKFDRVVLDTAPTGHTLRMLELPAFLQGLVKKLKAIREKTGAFSNMMGGSSSSGMSYDDRLDKFEKQMERLEAILSNDKESDFTVVTIPTDLAVAESKRLLISLRDSNISVRRLIINQMIPEQTASPDDAIAKAYLNRIKQGQKVSMNKLSKLAVDNHMDLVEVPYFDMEVRTVYGLRAFGNYIIPKK